MKPSETVSIIIPCYNHEKFITECIESVVGQTYKSIELVVIDDGSKDQSPQLIKNLAETFHFKFLLNSNQGLCRTINEALDHTSGKFVVIFASDDVMPPRRIAEQVDLFLLHPDFDVVAGGMTIIDEKSELKKYCRPLKLGLITFRRLLFRNLIYAPTAMIRREALEKVNRYDESFVLEDIAMWLKLSIRNMNIFNVDREWARYRIVSQDSIQKAENYHVHLLKVLNSFNEQSRLVEAAVQFAQFKFLMKMSVINKEVYERYYLLYRQKLWFVFKWPLIVLNEVKLLRHKN